MEKLFFTQNEITLFLEDYKLFTAIAVLLFSLSVTLLVMPKVIAISKLKNLTAQGNNRTSHKGIVPVLGGLGVFIGLLLTVNIAAVLFANYSQLVDLVIFNVLVLLLLIIGVADDILVIAPRKKLYYQIFIAFVFCLGTHMQIISFSGLFGLHTLHPIVAIIFSVFVIVLIINAYNLIDGIDGLAGVLGALISFVMAIVFYVTHHFFYALIALSLVGALAAFLVYNFSRHRKIFLGDSGSMVVGFVLAFQIVLYLNLSVNSQALVFKNAPVFVLALLSYPFLDTLRVFIVRIKNKQSPFIADRNHIHHRLLNLGLSHKLATLLIGVYTILVTAVAYVLSEVSINLAFAILLPVAIVLLGIPFCIKKTKSKYI